VKKAGKAAQNPFQYGRELGTELLVDREEEVAQVIGTIRDGGKLFLIGPRRYGKTSILKAAQEQVEAGAVVLRLDVEAYPTLEDLIAALVAEAARRLGGSPDKATDRLRRFFGRLKPEISYDLIEQTFSATIGAAVDPGDAASHVPLLVEALDGLEKMAGQGSQPVGLILDEFQRVVELGGARTEAQLRAAVQRHRHIGYVFAGSKTRMMSEMITHPARPFYNPGGRRFLGPVPRADFLVFLRRGFGQGGISVTAESLSLIPELAEDVPWNIQRLAHACWDRLTGIEGAELTTAAVRQALERLLREDDAFYTQLWNQLTPVQQRALAAALQEGGKELQGRKVVRKYGLSASTMSRALASLQAREILRPEERLGSVRLRLVDPFFGAWMKLITGI
jgi:hypothetical protein